MKSSKAIRWMVIAAAACAAGAAFAHPGHGSPGTTTTLTHLLSSPDHVLMLVAAVAAGVAALRGAIRGHESRRRKQRED
jgi:hydrogenase/urease accessory protein HupE